MKPTPKHLEALKRIAAIPLWGEPITDPAYGDKEELAECGEYDLDSDQYQPSVDSAITWLIRAVEMAREAVGGAP